MLKYVNENEYCILLDTDSIPDDFDNLVIEASSYINLHTFGRIDKNNIPEQVKYATCLIINLMDEENSKLSEIGSLKSQNIEGWSETYSSPEEIRQDYANKKQNVLKQYLWNVIGKDGNYLLYRGG